MIGKEPKIILLFAVFILFISALVFGLRFSGVFVFAQEQQESQNLQEDRKVLETELKELEEKISQYEKDIGKTEKEKKTLQNQISLLKRKIGQLDLQIRNSNLMIKDIGIQIKDTENSISDTSLEIENSRAKLADILREIYEKEQISLIEIMLSEQKLSGFFDNLMALESLNAKNHEILNYIKGLKIDLEYQKNSLDEEKSDLERTAKLQALQKQQSEKNKKDQEYFFKLTETQYQQYLKEKSAAEKKAAEIRVKLFDLIGVVKVPTFGEALDVAKYVEGMTGVRPAFLLAVLQQESAIGRNVGQCYLKDQATGEGIRVATGDKISRVMSAKRDVPPFLKITAELSRKWDETLVSCPMSFGYGGAIGPAQGLPSTLKVYWERLKRILEKSPDPWKIQDSFLFAGLFLSDYGAAKKTQSGEWSSAMIYFSGSTKNSQFNWYASQVLKKADCVQNFIDTNSMSLECQNLISLR